MRTNPTLDAPARPARRHRLAAIGLTAIAVAAVSAAPVAAQPAPGAATSPPDTHDPRFLAPMPGADRATPAGDRALARISHGGHVLTFVSHSALGTIGVFEDAPAGDDVYLAVMGGDGNGQVGPTALELFLAVSAAVPPAELVADHARGHSGPPEALDLPPLHGDDPADGECMYTKSLPDYQSYWAANWHFDVGIKHDLHAELSFLDDINGAEGKYYDANRSSARWLAACNGGNGDDESNPVAGMPNIYMEPQSALDGDWTGTGTHYVQPGMQAIYWSAGGPEHWRLWMRDDLHDSTTPDPRHWAIGGAIDKPFGLVGNGG